MGRAKTEDGHQLGAVIKHRDKEDDNGSKIDKAKHDFSPFSVIFSWFGFAAQTQTLAAVSALSLFGSRTLFADEERYEAGRQHVKIHVCVNLSYFYLSVFQQFKKPPDGAHTDDKRK